MEQLSTGVYSCANSPRLYAWLCVVVVVVSISIGVRGEGETESPTYAYAAATVWRIVVRTFGRFTTGHMRAHACVPGTVI